MVSSEKPVVWVMTPRYMHTPFLLSFPHLFFYARNFLRLLLRKISLKVSVWRFRVGLRSAVRMMIFSIMSMCHRTALVVLSLIFYLKMCGMLLYFSYYISWCELNCGVLKELLWINDTFLLYLLMYILRCKLICMLPDHSVRLLIPNTSVQDGIKSVRLVCLQRF